MRNLVAALATVGLLMPHNASAENVIYLQCLMNQGDWQGHPVNTNSSVYFMIDIEKKHVAEYNDLSKEYVDLCSIDQDIFKCDINNTYLEVKEFYKGEATREISIYRASGTIIDTHYVDGHELAQSRGNCSLGQNMQDNTHKF